MREKVILTSFDFANLARAKTYAPDYRVGLLYSNKKTSDPVGLLRSISGEQLCPFASDLTEKTVAHFHAMGFSVRAWGVKDEAIMAHACRCGVDGMTVNFPDKLHALLHP